MHACTRSKTSTRTVWVGTLLHAHTRAKSKSPPWQIALYRGSHPDLNVINSAGFWWHFYNATLPFSFSFFFILHYICMAALTEVTVKDHQPQCSLPGACIVIQSFRVKFPVWRDDLLLILTASPPKYAREDKCIMYNANDGHFNPHEKAWQPNGVSFFIFQFCFVLFCTFVWDHSVCHCVSAPGTGCSTTEESTICFLTHF